MIAKDVTSFMDGMFWGVVISTLLSGIVVCQGWTYYAHYNNDRWHLRLLVALLILMDISITFLNCDILRQSLVTGFGIPDTLLLSALSSTGLIILTNIVAYLCELFFASRIYFLDKRLWWAAAIAGLFATGSFICLMLPLGPLGNETQASAIMNHNTRLWEGMGLIFAIVSAITITAVLPMELSSMHTSIKRTQKILQRLQLFIVTRGLLVTLNSTACLIVYEIGPHTTYWMPFMFCNSRLQVISIVAMLNARPKIPPVTEQLDGNMISVLNTRSPDKAFNSKFTGNSVDNSSHSSVKSHALCLASVSDQAGDMLNNHGYKMSF